MRESECSARGGAAGGENATNLDRLLWVCDQPRHFRHKVVFTKPTKPRAAHVTTKQLNHSGVQAAPRCCPLHHKRHCVRVLWGALELQRHARLPLCKDGLSSRAVAPTGEFDAHVRRCGYAEGAQCFVVDVLCQELRLAVIPCGSAGGEMNRRRRMMMGRAKTTRTEQMASREQANTIKRQRSGRPCCDLSRRCIMRYSGGKERSDDSRWRMVRSFVEERASIVNSRF